MFKKTGKLPSDVNYQFYRNQFRSIPDAMLVDDLLSEWYHNYDMLEWKHGYIQWLFPELNRLGSNPQAKMLEENERKLMRDDAEIGSRIVKAYQMMLNFYGFVMINEETGEMKRCNDEAHVKQRFNNLITRTHNHDRIRRMFHSLAQTGFKRYLKNWITTLEKEVTMENGPLKSCEYSLNYKWKPAYQKMMNEFASDPNESAFFLKFSKK